MKARETGSLRCTATPVNFILEVGVFLAKVSVDFSYGVKGLPRRDWESRELESRHRQTGLPPLFADLLRRVAGKRGSVPILGSAGSVPRTRRAAQLAP